MKCKCENCIGFYKDGRDDCEVTGCALYPWMPYRKLQQSHEDIILNLTRSKNKREKGRLLVKNIGIQTLKHYMATPLQGDRVNLDLPSFTESDDDDQQGDEE